MGSVLAGIDAGTTGARCALFDLSGNLVGTAYREYGAEYARPGWVEQNAAHLLEQTYAVCRECVIQSGVDPAEIAAIGLSSQRSVTCPVGADGTLTRPMISWQDARTDAEVKDIAAQISAPEYAAITGLPLGTTWILTKLLWMRKHEPRHFERTVRFVQHQDLVLKAFGADDYHTDLCDMGFYGLWDIRAASWSQELLRRFGFTAAQFGAPVPAGTQVGVVPVAVAAKTGFAAGTPVCAGAGDQNCSVIGMGAIKPGMATVTLGTAGLAILTVDRPTAVERMMVTHHAIKGLWEVEGLANAAAASLRWYRDVLQRAQARSVASENSLPFEKLSEAAGRAPAGSKGLLFLPYLATAAAPRWNADARAAFLGLSFAHGHEEITRAVMEGVGLEMRDMMECWLRNQFQIDVIRLGGGAARSAVWTQIQADIYGRPVQTMACGESTVLGAALLGGVGIGLFKDIPEGVRQMVHLRGEVAPNMANHALYEELYGIYTAAYEAMAADNGVYARMAALQKKLC